MVCDGVCVCVCVCVCARVCVCVCYVETFCLNKRLASTFLLLFTDTLSKRLRRRAMPLWCCSLWHLEASSALYKSRAVALAWRAWPHASPPTSGVESCPASSCRCKPGRQRGSLVVVPRQPPQHACNVAACRLKTCKHAFEDNSEHTLSHTTSHTFAYTSSTHHHT